MVYLNDMLANPNPVILVDPYTISPSGNNYSISGMSSSNTATLITIDSGPDSGASYVGSISCGITESAPNNPTSGFLVEEIDLSGPSNPASSLFSSTHLLSQAFGPVAGHPGVAYWFAFTEDTSTFYGPAGTIVGGLVTTSGNDIKEYTFPAAGTPTPGAAQGGLVLMLGLVIRRVFYGRKEDRAS
jgi:hypothetical protein